MAAPGLKTGCRASTCFQRECGAEDEMFRASSRLLSAAFISERHDNQARQSYFSLIIAPSYLSVIGQVVGTVHELLQRAARPVGALVAGRQLFGRRRASVAHVQRGFPRGTALHVPPFAEVSRHRVP